MKSIYHLLCQAGPASEAELTVGAVKQKIWEKKLCCGAHSYARHNINNKPLPILRVAFYQESTCCGAQKLFLIEANEQLHRSLIFLRPLASGEAGFAISI